jgi:hypothetical protein
MTYFMNEKAEQKATQATQLRTSGCKQVTVSLPHAVPSLSPATDRAPQLPPQTKTKINSRWKRFENKSLHAKNKSLHAK